MVCFTLFIRAKQIKIYSTVNGKWSGKPGSNWRPQPWQGFTVLFYICSVSTANITFLLSSISIELVTVT